MKVDVVIIGGGMVGAVTALALAKADFSVAVVEAHQQDVDAQVSLLNGRVSAVNVASIEWLDQLGLWSEIPATMRSALQSLRVWDDVGGGEIEFDSADAGIKALGAIVPNQAIVQAAWRLLSNQSNVSLRHARPVAAESVDAGVTVTLDDQTKLSADLCVGADGALSWLRDQMGVKLAKRPYHQKAIIAAVSTESFHQHSGWQAFLPSGPLALLPLANPHHCAIVWSATTDRADALMAMDAAEFECEINNDFGVRLGQIQLLGDRQAFPLVMRHVGHYVQPGFALVGDAAHTIHPLAGQGVNLGFMDAKSLVTQLLAAKAKNQAIGAMKTLRRYERSRKGDNAQMICAMRTFKELFGSTSSILVGARSHGFNTINSRPSIKRVFMRVALGID